MGNLIQISKGQRLESKLRERSSSKFFKCLPTSWLKIGIWLCIKESSERENQSIKCINQEDLGFLEVTAQYPLRVILTGNDCEYKSELLSIRRYCCRNKFLKNNQREFQRSS